MLSFCSVSFADCCQPKCCSDTKVVYKDQRNIAPCAVEKKISVEIFNSCTCKCETVEVSICVPKCECFEVKCRKNRKIYDYGKYEVDVSVKNGLIIVNYNN